MTDPSLQAMANVVATVAAICAMILTALGYKKQNGWHKLKPKRRPRPRARRTKKKPAVSPESDTAGR